jgi:polysaccharide export outer membrane protein
MIPPNRRESPLRPALAALLIPLVLAVGCGSAAPRSERVIATTARPLPVPASFRREPAGDYRIGAEDVLAVRVLDLEKPGEPALLEPVVGPGGEIALPYLGLVQAAGRTTAELRAAIAAGLGARYLVDPQVAVAVKEYRSRRIEVLGAVNKPGTIYLDRNRTSVVEALARAGGLSKEAGTRAIVTPAPSSATATPASGPIEVDLVRLLAEGGADIPLDPGACVQVPIAEQFVVMGFVNRPGAFPYQRPTTILEAVGAAGGLHERKASPSEVRITRMTPAGPVRIQVDLDAIAKGEAPNVPVLPGDSIEAGRTTARAIYSEFVDVFLNRIGAGFSLGGL